MVIVDGDNVPPAVLGPVLAHMQKVGPVTQRRVYRNWRSTKDSRDWDHESKRHAFERVDRYKTSEGKNASDIAVAVEAVDLYHAGFRRFAIVSGDTDFAPLIERLRRGGCHVTVVGHHDNAELLQELADEYILWRTLVGPASGSGRPSARSSGSRDSARSGTAMQASSSGRAGGSGARRSDAQPSQRGAGGRSSRGGRGAAAPRAAPKAAAGASASRQATARGPGKVDDLGLRAALVDAYEVALTDGIVDAQGWCPVARLGQIAREVKPDFSPQTYGLGSRTPLYKMFSRFKDQFTLELMGQSGRGAQYRVKMVRRG